MVIVNGDGRIPIINSQTERLFGYRREDLMSQPIEILVPERFGTGHPAHRMDYPAESRVRAVGEGRELYGLRRDGSHAKGSPLHGPSRDIVRWYGGCEDIDERKEPEDTLR